MRVSIFSGQVLHGNHPVDRYTGCKFFPRRSGILRGHYEDTLIRNWSGAETRLTRIAAHIAHRKRDTRFSASISYAVDIRRPTGRANFRVKLTIELVAKQHRVSSGWKVDWLWRKTRTLINRYWIFFSCACFKSERFFVY